MLKHGNYLGFGGDERSGTTSYPDISKIWSSGPESYETETKDDYRFITTGAVLATVTPAVITEPMQQVDKGDNFGRYSGYNNYYSITNPEAVTASNGYSAETPALQRPYQQISEKAPVGSWLVQVPAANRLSENEKKFNAVSFFLLV